MHPLLTRQIGRYLGGAERHNLELQCFINAVEQAYRQFEEDALLNERALELVSQELNESNSSLRLELAEHSKIKDALAREKTAQAKLLEEVEQARNQLLLSEKPAESAGLPCSNKADQSICGALITPSPKSE